KILQAAREIAGDRRKLREHSAAFVSRFAQTPGVLVTQRLLERGKMLRDACGERLTHFSEQDRVAPTGGQQHRRVEQVPPAGFGGYMCSEYPIDGRQQIGGTDRLGLEVIHAGCEAALAILFPGARRQGNDWQVSPRG